MDILSVYKPEFWAQETLLQLWPRLTMANLAYRNFEPIIAEQGDTVNTRITDKFTAVPANPDAFASVKPTAQNVKITMDQWYEVVFEIGDKESSLTMKKVYDEYLPNASQAIAQVIETALMSRYVDLWGSIGTPGTAPSSVDKLCTNVKQRFDELQIPRDSRNVILSPAHENYFNQIFYQAFVSGSAAQQTTGELMNKFGMQYAGADLLPAQVAGTAAGAVAAKINGAVAAVTTATADPRNNFLVTFSALGNAKTLVAGDLLTIGTGTAAFPAVVVTGGTSSAGGDLAGVMISTDAMRYMSAGIADQTAVTILGSHNVSLAFHQQAFALVSRPLKAPEFPGANVYVAVMNGIGLRATLWYSPKDLRSYVRLDILFGTKTLDGRKGFRIIS